MTTLLMQSGSGLRGPLRGWAISLAVHALVLAWLVHAVPAARYLHDPVDQAPERRSQLILVPVRPLPAPAPVSKPAQPSKPAPAQPASGPAPMAAPAARAKPAPAAAPSRQVRDEPQPALTPPAATGTLPGAAAAQATPGPENAAPGFDVQAARGAVRAALKGRIGEPGTPAQPSTLQATRDEKLGNAIDRGRTPDCQTKYAGGPSLNIILLIPLAIDTLKDSGCKWR